MSDIYARYFASSQDERLRLDFERHGPFAVSIFRNLNKDHSGEPERQLVYHGEHDDKANIEVPSERHSVYEVVIGAPKKGQLTFDASARAKDQPKDSVKVEALRSARVDFDEAGGTKDPWPTVGVDGFVKRSVTSDHD